LGAQDVKLQGKALTLQGRYRRLKYFRGLPRSYVALHRLYIGTINEVLVAQGFVGIIFRRPLLAGRAGGIGVSDGRTERDAGSSKEKEEEVATHKGEDRTCCGF
jgi:hypothetical protein